MLKHVIFDSDGVLVDSFYFHLRKLNEYFDDPITEDEYRGMHDGNFYSETASSARFKTYDFNSYSAFVAEEQSKLPLNEGVVETLEELAKTCSLHLVTSGWKIQVLPLLGRNNITRYFSSLFFADEGKSKHEKINKIVTDAQITTKECIYVTDTIGDIREAQLAGVPTMAVTFGYHSEEKLRLQHPTYIVHSWPEILQTVKEYR